MAHMVMICGLDYADRVESQRAQGFTNNGPFSCDRIVVNAIGCAFVQYSYPNYDNKWIFDTKINHVFFGRTYIQQFNRLTLHSSVDWTIVTMCFCFSVKSGFRTPQPEFLSET